MLIPSLLLIYSCEEIVDIDIEKKERRLVINGVLYPDSLIKLDISRSLSVLEDVDSNYWLTPDVVLLQDGHGREVPLSETRKGHYASQERAVAGGQYSLKVGKEGYPTVTAKTHVPTRPEVLDLDTTRLTDQWGWASMQCQMTLNDPPAQNYYIIRTYSLHYWVDSTGTVGAVQVDTLTDKGPFYAYPSVSMGEEELWDTYGLIFEDATFNGQQYTYMFEFDAWNIDYADTVLVELQSLTPGLYKYLRSRSQANESKDNPLSQPVQVYSNINNGLGIFGGACPVEYALAGNTQLEWKKAIKPAKSRK